MNKSARHSFACCPGGPRKDWCDEPPGQAALPSTIEAPRNRHAAGESLDGAASRRFGDVLAPEWLAARRLAAEFLAITSPLDALALRLQDLHGTAREGVGP